MACSDPVCRFLRDSQFCSRTDALNYPANQVEHKAPAKVYQK